MPSMNSLYNRPSDRTIPSPYDNDKYSKAKAGRLSMPPRSLAIRILVVLAMMSFLLWSFYGSETSSATDSATQHTPWIVSEATEHKQPAPVSSGSIRKPAYIRRDSNNSPDGFGTATSDGKPPKNRPEEEDEEEDEDPAEMKDQKAAEPSKQRKPASEKPPPPKEKILKPAVPPPPPTPEKPPAMGSPQAAKDPAASERIFSERPRPSPLPAKPSTWKDAGIAVRRAFEHAWGAYRKYAWGQDHVYPIQKTGHQWFYVGLTLVDSLDTMMIMNVSSTLIHEARDWVEHGLEWTGNANANVFELTIRVLGGFLTAYHLTQDDLYLRRARELGDQLLVAFDTPSGIPRSSYNFATKMASFMDFASSTAEAATLQLEWRYLSYLTKDLRYWKAAEKVMKVMLREEQPKRFDGLVPIFIDFNSGDFLGDNIRLGSRGDSYYEYLAKQWFQTDQMELMFRDRFEEAMDGVLVHLVQYSSRNRYLFVGELPEGRHGSFSPKMDHLVCFLPGTMMLYVTKGARLTNSMRATLDTKMKRYVEVAEELTRTCYETYRQTASGLSPEIVYFQYRGAATGADIEIRNADAFSILRPETVESLFYMYRFTGDQIYRDWGWEIFRSIERYARVDEAGYACLSDVRVVPPPQDSGKHMESFFLAETLKYLYLLFDDDAANRFPLDQYVFNTEAHPLPILPLRSPQGQAFVKLLRANGLGLWTGMTDVKQDKPLRNRASGAPTL